MIAEKSEPLPKEFELPYSTTRSSRYSTFPTAFQAESRKAGSSDNRIEEVVTLKRKDGKSVNIALRSSFWTPYCNQVGGNYHNFKEGLRLGRFSPLLSKMRVFYYWEAQEGAKEIDAIAQLPQKGILLSPVTVVYKTVYGTNDNFGKTMGLIVPYDLSDPLVRYIVSPPCVSGDFLSEPKQLFSLKMPKLSTNFLIRKLSRLEFSESDYRELHRYIHHPETF